MAGKRANSDSGSDNDIDSGSIDGFAESGVDSGASGPIDPASLGTDEFERDSDGNLVYGASGKPRRKRGRKSGGSSGGSSAGASKSGARNSQNLGLGLETLSNSLMIVHVGLAALTDFKKWELEKKESDALSASIANVMEQFDMTPDPRFAAIAGLLTTGAMIYGPRLYLYKEYTNEKQRKRVAEKAEQAPANQQQFTDMSGFNLSG